MANTNEEMKVKAKQWRLENIPRTLVHSAKKRSKEKGVPFDITHEDITVPEICPILLKPLKINQFGDKTHSEYSPSLDRIVPELGYVKGNIQVISHKANAMKNSATREDLINFANWIYNEFK